jgi:hypothetical protein
MLDTMRQGSVRGWSVGAVLALGIVAGACGPKDPHAARPDDELSVERLGDDELPRGIMSALDDDERDALSRSGMTGLSVAPGRDDEDFAGLDDEPPTRAKKVERAGFSVFVVAASLAAAAAPFFLF